jgi:transposase
MRPIELPELSPAAIEELATLYRTTHNMRLHIRAQLVLVAAEQHMVAADIALIVRTDEQTMRRWLKRYRAEGIAGLRDAPHPGATPTVTANYKAKLALVARQRPRSLGQPDSLWTCQRLADYLAEQTGIRVSDETARHYLIAAEIVLSRPQHKITRPAPEYEVKKDG